MIPLSDIIILTASSALLAVALTRAYGSGDESADQSQRLSQSQTSKQVSAQNTSAPQVDSQTKIQTSTQEESATAQAAPSPSVTLASSDGSTVSASITSDPVAPAMSTYVVRSGDSLSKIANRFGTSVRELQSLNALNNTRILVGQKLSYPTQ